MSIREAIIDWSKGDRLHAFWRLFRWRERCSVKVVRDSLTFFLNRMAHRHGGYIGNGARFTTQPFLPHGLHGIYISRYAKIGKDCHIYQNVTIGSIGKQAPQIGDHCFIGAGAIIIGNIKVGDHAKIGAGAVVNTDVPSYATVVPQPSRIIVRGQSND